MLNRRIRRRRSSVGMLAFPRGGDCFFASLARSVGEEPVSRCETVLPRTLSGAAGRSVHRVAQTLARLEARQAGGGDLQGGAGLRVAAFAGGAFLDGEGTEADQGNAVTFAQGRGDGFGEGIQRTGGGGFRQ